MPRVQDAIPILGCRAWKGHSNPLLLSRLRAERLDIAVVRASFRVRQDGQLVRHQSHIGALAHEPATSILNGKQLVRVCREGRVHRLMASKVAWIVHAGQHPRGPIRHRDGDLNNFAASNLIETRHGRDPFVERQARVTRLIDALSAHPGSTVPQLSRLVGSSSSYTCVRLSKLADAGLCIGPRCDSRARWDLSERGRELAASTDPVVLLDDRDRQVLAALALTSMGTMKLARRVEVCPMTIRRRVRLLVERGLVFADPRKFYTITDAGPAALGPDTPKRPAPWVKVEAVSAANASDVRTRLQHPNDDRSAAERSRHGSKARAKALQTTQANQAAPFNAFPDWLLTG
jgi:hypothetical protein